MQKLRYSRYFKVFFILLDVVVFTTILLGVYVQKNSLPTELLFSERNIILFVVLSVFWLLLSGKTKLYSVPRSLTYTKYLERLLIHLTLFILGVFFIFKIADKEFINQRIGYLSAWLFSVLFILKSAIFFALKMMRSQGMNYRNIMFLAENASTESLKQVLMKRKDYGYRIFGYPHEKVHISELKKFWKSKGIHALYLPWENSFPEQLKDEIYKEANLQKIKVILVPGVEENLFSSYELRYVESQPILAPAKFPLDFIENYYLKRIFDVFFSILALALVGSWLVPLVALLIKLDSKGSVFFKQKRYGQGDMVFHCLKFRTMVKNNQSDTQTTQPQDCRITRIGRFLRKSSIDEFPQFINVLKGDMSVVGPRPHMLVVDDFYKEKISRYPLRSLVKPGITGLAQVTGLRGDHGDMMLEMNKRILADSFYVRNWSIVLDMIIILKTIILILKGDKKAL